MDSKGTGDLLFRFRSPRHERINERLLRLVGPGPAAFYRDACRVMDNEALLETSTHQVAHCLREMEAHCGTCWNRSLRAPTASGRRASQVTKDTEPR